MIKSKSNDSEHSTKSRELLYEKNLLDAMNDPDFIEHNIDVEKIFEHSDKKVPAMCPDW